MGVTGKIESIKNYITSHTSLSEAFVDDVDLRLQSLGYEIQNNDIFAVQFAICKVEKHIHNETNQTTMPEGLYYRAIDIVCGEILFSLKSSGQLQGFDIDLEVMEKAIQEGDTKIEFAVGRDGVSLTPEQRLDSLISYLMDCGKCDFVTYRRVKW